MKLSSTVRNLIESHSRLSGMPYSAPRNRALEAVQRRLESHGLFNRYGQLVTTSTRREGGFMLTAGGVK